jgi:hypothetical protein
MNQTTKIILAVIVGLIACCCLALAAVSFLGPVIVSRTMGTSFTEEPADAAAIGAKIVDYTLPPGYSETFGMDFFGVSMVGITPPPSDGELQPDSIVFLIMQTPEGWMSEEEMRQQMMDSLSGQTQGGESQLVEVAREKRMVKGEEVEFVVYEGTTGEGDPLRQVMGVIPGKTGPAMLMIMGSPAMWNQETADAFIDSLR